MGNCSNKDAREEEETDPRKFAISRLQNVCIFSSITLEDEIVLRELSFMPGDDIVVQGDDVIDLLYLLRSGNCSVIKDGEVINMMSKGSIIGERAFLAQSTRTATVRAIDQCRYVNNISDL